MEKKYKRPPKEGLIDKIIEESRKKFNNRFSYDKYSSVYATNKSIIVCNIHGEFESSLTSHQRSPHGYCIGCKFLSFWEERKKYFIKRYGKQFNYSKFEYSGQLNPSIIICKDHGEFLVDIIQHDKKLNGGCEECAKEYKKSNKYIKYMEEMSIKLKSDFMEKGNGIYNFKYDYSMFKYVNKDTSSTIICPEHGDFIRTPHQHLKNVKGGCTDCFKVKKLVEKRKKYLKRLESIHGKSYKFDMSNFFDTWSIIEVRCDKEQHQSFNRIVGDFLYGNERLKCPECREEEYGITGLGLYNMNSLMNNEGNKDDVVFLYYIKIGDKYKIGISKDLKERFRHLRYRAKIDDIEIIYSEKMTLYEAIYLEDCILDNNNEYREYSEYSTEIFGKNIFENIEIKYYIESIKIPEFEEWKSIIMS